MYIVDELYHCGSYITKIQLLFSKMKVIIQSTSQARCPLQDLTQGLIL